MKKSPNNKNNIGPIWSFDNCLSSGETDTRIWGYKIKDTLKICKECYKVALVIRVVHEEEKNFAKMIEKNWGGGNFQFSFFACSSYLFFYELFFICKNSD